MAPSCVLLSQTLVVKVCGVIFSVVGGLAVGKVTRRAGGSSRQFCPPWLSSQFQGSERWALWETPPSRPSPHRASPAASPGWVWAGWISGCKYHLLHPCSISQ